MIPSAPVIRAAITLLRYVPVRLARILAAAGGTLAWMVQSERRETLIKNLSYIALDRSPSERRRLAKRTFRNLAVTAVDQFRLPSITPKELRDLFEIRGIEHLDTSLARGKGVIVVTGHLGPYELASACVAAMGYPIHGMVENLEPALLEALASYRSATGMQLVNMKDGLRGAYRVLGQNHVLALVADRAIGDARGAIDVPFAGGKRPMPIGATVFAQATGAPIITAFAWRNPAGSPRYVMAFDPPVFAAGRDESERLRLLQHIVERMEVAIRRNPDQWYVFQPDWIE
ncbi:MAG TPA: lysophospholipid acyltransferase family protein [Gemmatimonadaceae bacterium]